jgi:hypothetical protein
MSFAADYRFAADYHGTCSDCWGHIVPGQMVEYRKVEGANTQAGLLCHVECPQDELPLKYGVCEKCFMEKTAAGTCGCL